MYACWSCGIRIESFAWPSIRAFRASITTVHAPLMLDHNGVEVEGRDQHPCQLPSVPLHDPAFSFTRGSASSVLASLHLPPPTPPLSILLRSEKRFASILPHLPTTWVSCGVNHVSTTMASVRHKLASPMEATMGRAGMSAIARRSFIARFRNLSSAVGAETRVVEVQDDAHFERELKEAEGLAVADYTAVWCGPCRSIAPTFAAMSTQLPHVKFLKVDIDSEDLEKTVREAGITAVPTFHFFRKGMKVDEFSGASVEHLQQKVEQLAQEG